MYLRLYVLRNNNNADFNYHLSYLGILIKNTLYYYILNKSKRALA